MKQKLEENNGIPASLLWILAIISGLSVALWTFVFLSIFAE